MNEPTASSEYRDKLNDLPAHLKERIIGQDHLLPRIASVLKRGELGLTKAHRPRGSFLFLGPTGVGKTEVALTFSDYLFGLNHVHRFDMSEYQTQDSMARLLGESSRDAGILGRALQSTRKGTLLFDEIEKAHPRVLDVFLQILDAARVTLATGETLDFSNYYVVLTSNIGSTEIMELEHSSFATMERHVLSQARQNLRPEIFARVTERLVFKKLTYEVQLQIADLFLRRELEFLATMGCNLTLHRSALPLVVRLGFDARLGARPLRDTVESLVGDAVAQALLEGKKVHGELAESSSGQCIAILSQGDV